MGKVIPNPEPDPGTCTATDAKWFTFSAGTITGYDIAGPKEVCIPSEINGQKVETIGKTAFY